MAVKVQAPIEPYNDSYKAVNAKHVGVGEGANEKSLDEVLKNLPSGGSDITVDTELSLESENPVQNKVVTQEFKAFNEAIGDTNRRVSALESGGVGGGGVSSWNDLTDKPFDDNVTTIFDGVLQDTQSGDTWMGEPSAEDTSDAALVVGQTYTYTWGGKEYTSVCFILEGINCIGNNAPVSGVDNGQPVVIFRHPTKWEAIVINNRNDTDGTYSLKITTAIKQLDNKYLAILERKASEKVLLPSYTGTTQYDNGFSVYALSPGFVDAQMFEHWHGIDESIAPIEGNIFVEFDGVTYECAQQRLAALDYAMAIGNCTPFGGTGNNEPFICTILNADAGNGDYVYYWAIGVLGDTAPTEHTVKVYQPLGEIKYMLKEEYLPFGVIAEYIGNYIDEALGGDY